MTALRWDTSLPVSTGAIPFSFSSASTIDYNVLEVNPTQNPSVTGYGAILSILDVNNNNRLLGFNELAPNSMQIKW